MFEINQAKQIFIQALISYQARCNLPEDFRENKENYFLITEPRIDKLFNWFRNKSGLDGYLNAISLMATIKECENCDELIQLIASTKAGPNLRKILIDCVLEVSEVTGQHVDYHAYRLCKAKNHGLDARITEGNPLYYQRSEFINPAKNEIYRMVISSEQEFAKFMQIANREIERHSVVQGHAKFTQR